MSSIEQAIKTQVNNIALLFLGPFLDWVTENIEVFEDKPDKDKIFNKMVKELKLETGSTKNKLSDALKGMGISKSGTTSKNKTTAKTDDGRKRWINLKEYQERVENYTDEDFCTYSPPRGGNKDTICGRVADVKNSTNSRETHTFRCDDCEGKTGRGKKVMAGEDNSTSKSIKRNPILGVTKRKSARPTEGRSNKKKINDSSDESNEDSDDASGDDSKESLELTPNKSITKLLGKNYFIYTISNIGTCLVNLNAEEQIVTFYGKFNSEVSASTNVTLKMLKELAEVKESKISKKDMSDNFAFKKPSSLDLSKLKKTDEEPKKDRDDSDNDKNSKSIKKGESSQEDKPTKSNKKKQDSSEEEPVKPVKSKKKQDSSEEDRPARSNKKEESVKSKKKQDSSEEDKPAKSNKKEESVKSKKKQDSSEKEPNKKVISPSEEEQTKPVVKKAPSLSEEKQTKPNKKVISPSEEELAKPSDKEVVSPSEESSKPPAKEASSPSDKEEETKPASPPEEVVKKTSKKIISPEEDEEPAE